MAYKYLLFDLDNTLVDDSENHKYAFKELLKDQRLEYSDSLLKKWLEIDHQFWLDFRNGIVKSPKILQGKKAIDWVQAQRFIRFLNELSLDEAITINQNYIKAQGKKVFPYEGTRDLLELLVQKGFKIIIITNGPGSAAEQKIQLLKCDHLIEKIYAADKYFVAKPRKELYDFVFQDFSMQKSDYLMIGDSLFYDITGAQNAGIDSCWFNPNEIENETNQQPTYIVQNFKELKKILIPRDNKL